MNKPLKLAAKLNSTQEIIDDIKAGKMVVIMDDEDRENEGDLLMAAHMVNADHINFMARYGRGLICLTLSERRCKQLRLPLMVGDNREVMETNFTVSIEAAEGVTTGISAADRATTIQAAIRADATPDSIVQPGHVFPVMARKGGVLFRAGHTEAGCDLTRLAGFEPAAVIVEILNDDGTMARRKDLEQFAVQHDLKIGTIEDLIRYRIENFMLLRTVPRRNCIWPWSRVRSTRKSQSWCVYMCKIRSSIHSLEPRVVVGHYAILWKRLTRPARVLSCSCVRPNLPRIWST